MRRFIRPSPLTFFGAFVVAWCISLFAITACRKFEAQSNRTKPDNTARFLRTTTATHPAVARVVDKMRRMNLRNNFINTFVDKHGFALWDKAIVRSVPSANNSARGEGGEEDYSLMIPIAWDNSDLIHAAIAAKVTEDSVFFAFLDGDNFATYNADSATKGLNGRQLSATLMHLDNEVYGHGLFRVTDSASFPSKGDGKVELVNAPDSVVISGSSERTVIISYVICYTIWVPPHNGQLVGCPPGDNNCNAYVPLHYCDFYTVIADDGYEYGDENPPPPPQEGGGGGSGPGNDLCRLFPGGMHNCGNGGPPGFAPIDDHVDDANYYNVDFYDSIFIKGRIKDSFPCLYNFLKDSLQPNHIAQKIDIDLFQDSLYIHLNFDISDSLQPGMASAVTMTKNLWVNGDGYTEGIATIYFNRYNLRHGTKEYMISTIIHELMHAAFAVRWAQYKKWLLINEGPYDSNYIKSHFPMFWHQMNGFSFPPGPAGDHQAMAVDYLDDKDSIMQQFFNPAAPQAVRDSVIKALGWAGLHGTPAWKLLPSQGADTCKYKNMTSTAENSGTGSTAAPGCTGSPMYHYSNDLKMRPSCN